MAALLASSPLAAQIVRTPHVEAELVSATAQFRRGQTHTVAVRLKPDAHWHTYWINPGDSGLATRLVWQLPDGVQAGPIQWPAPTRFSLGDIVNYGYDGETLHLVQVQVPAQLPGDQLTLKVTAHWLVCADICIPGSADLQLSRPLIDGAPQADPEQAAAFAEAMARLPREPALPGRHEIGADEVRFELELPEPAQSAYLYPIDNELVNHSAAPRVDIDGRRLRVAQAPSPYLDADRGVREAVLVLDEDPHRAWRVRLTPGEVAAVAGSVVGGPPAAGAERSLTWVLLAAFVGGLILNLMPCVLPVLAIKALSLLDQRGAERAQQRLHAFSYTLGVVASCLLIAGVLLAARAAGEMAGWGFQLQNPAVVGFLTYVMVAIGLSLAGVVTFSGRFIGAGQQLAAAGGLTGSFFTGVLAVVVASPCTAPLMGAALGFAMTQSAPVALLVFATLGLGLATPFLLIGLFPRLGGWLPRPGPWMEGFKQLLAFPMFFTAVWLVWVLTRQTGADGGAAVLTGVVTLSLALWLLGRDTARLGRVLALVLVLAALALLRLPERPAVEAANAAADSRPATDQSLPYTAERLAALRASGDTVFLNLTADWCLSCLANERVTLRAPSVLAAFARDDVHYLKGDWTNGDPQITALLDSFGRNGVPLYVVYRADAEPRILPQVLTPDIVLDALEP